MTLALTDKTLPPTTPEILEKIAIVESRIRPREVQVPMEHCLHAGMYARTCRLPANMVITSVLVKIPTLLIVNGACVVLAGEEWREIRGYVVIQASAGRKQIYVTTEPTEITMVFPSNAKNVEEAEDEFSDESANLLSRRAECPV